MKHKKFEIYYNTEESFQEEKSNDFNTLWNDELHVGRPICRNCINVLHGWVIKHHLNYEPIRIRKPKGLDRWL